MNLRNVTIWTTGIMPILAAAALTILGYFDADPHKKFTISEEIVIGSVIWLFSGWPLMFVSCIVAQKLNNNFLLAILFVATIIHASLICSLHCAGYAGWSIPIRTLLCIGTALFLVMLPVWIAVLVLNRYYAKQSEPQCLDGESEPVA